MSGMSDDTKKLVEKTMRPDKRMSAEDLVANELATAILSERMNKIRHSLEALMLLGDDERKSASIDEETVEKADDLYEICTCLQNVFVDKFTNRHGEVIERSATIPWPFDREQTEDRLGWIDSIQWKLYMDLDDKESVAEAAKELDEKGKELEALYLVTSERVTVETFRRIRVQFCKYAMPFAGKLLKKIITLVSSSSFKAAMDRLKGGVSSG